MPSQMYLTYAEFVDQGIPSDALTGLSQPTVEKALAWASALAGGYIAKRYKLPLVSWGDELRAAVGDLARWRIFGRIGVRPGSGNNEIAYDAYKDAKDWLVQISNGLTELDCVDSTPTIEEQGSLSESDAPLSFRFVTGDADDNAPEDDC